MLRPLADIQNPPRLGEAYILVLSTWTLVETVLLTLKLGLSASGCKALGRGGYFVQEASKFLPAFAFGFPESPMPLN